MAVICYENHQEVTFWIFFPLAMNGKRACVQLMVVPGGSEPPLLHQCSSCIGVDPVYTLHGAITHAAFSPPLTRSVALVACFKGIRTW